MATEIKALSPDSQFPARQAVTGGVKRLVATMVATLPPGDYTDPATTGLQLRVRAKRDGFSRTWLFRFSWRGQGIRTVIGHAKTMSLVEARSEAGKLAKALDEGIDPRRARPKRRERVAAPPPSSAAPRPDDKHSVEFLISEFTERYLRPGRKRPEYAEAILTNKVLPEWTGRDARTITPGEVVALLDKIVDRGRRVMANRTAALLSQLFRFGIQRHIVAMTPVQLLYRPGGKEKPRSRALNDDELTALLLSLEDVFTHARRTPAAIRLFLYTACRRSELALAEWKQFDLKSDAPTWTVPAEGSKTGTEYQVPLVAAAVTELKRLKMSAGRSAYLFPAKNGSTDKPADPMILTRSLARNLDRLSEHKIAAFTLHDLRRTVRTGLGRLKVAPHIAELCLNHAQRGIIATYDTHAYMDEKRAALEQWADHLRSLELKGKKKAA
jgi:integrase